MYRIAFIISLVIISAHTALGLSGSGTQEDPWRIQSLEDFNEFAADANYWSGYTRLETDVNLARLTYTTAVIAPDVNGVNGYFDGTAFTGVFDGNLHKLINLTIDDGGAGNDYVGLFGGIDGGEVRNLGLEGSSVSGEWHVAGFVGELNGYGIVWNCYSTGSVSGMDFIGGLVGKISFGRIVYCCSTGDVNGVDDVGGLVGRNSGFCNPERSRISLCYSTCDVIGVNYVGGLVGNNGGSVSRCYSTGDVNGNNTVGGLAGVTRNWGWVSNCYSTGDVSGVDDVGGLVGRSYDGGVWSCCSTGNVNGFGNVGGLVGENSGCQMEAGGTIKNCYSTGDVIGVDKVSGLVGYFRCGYMSNCYFTGDVNGKDYVGGLVGSNDWGSAIISNCYLSGDVNGINYIGGLAGYNNSYSSVSNCFWDTEIQTHGVTDSIGYNDGTVTNVEGLPTAQMQTRNTFTDAGWDFVDVWDLTCEGMNYPRFIWQIKPADFLCPHGVNFRDYSFFAGYWGDTNCGDSNDCDGTDFDLSGTVDIKDIDMFCGHWLEGVGG